MNYVHSQSVSDMCYPYRKRKKKITGDQKVMRESNKGLSQRLLHNIRALLSLWNGLD